MSTITASVDSVLVASTSNLTLSGEQMIDGVLTSASRVLVKNQSSPSLNGIYVTGPGAWTRATDFSTTVIQGTFVFVIAGGVTNGSTGWIVSNIGSGLNGAIVVGTDPIVFAEAYVTPYLYPPGSAIYAVSSPLGICKATVQSVAVSQTNVLNPAVTTYTIVYSNPARGSAQVDSSTVFAQTTTGLAAAQAYYAPIIT